MRMIVIMLGVGCCVGMAVPAHAAVERKMDPIVVPQTAVMAPATKSTTSQASTLQADRPDFHLPFDYRPAHPSDELHRFPSDDLIAPLRDGHGDESFRGQLRG